MYKMILADGTELKGFQKNGDNYIIGKKVDESVFEGNLSTLTITDGKDDEKIMRNAVLIQQVEYEDGFHLCFRELSAQELRDMELDAKIEYLAMMTDVDMEEV